jgi:hypothetical protein
MKLPVCITNRISCINPVSILRQSRRLCGCWPLEGAGSQSNFSKAVQVHDHVHVKDKVHECTVMNLVLDLDLALDVDSFSNHRERKHTPEKVKLMLPHRQSWWISQQSRNVVINEIEP